MGLVESDIEMMLNERDIKTFAIIADNHFVFLDVLNKIIKIFPVNICFNRLTVIKGNGGYIVEIALESCGFDIQIDRGIPEFWE